MTLIVNLPDNTDIDTIEITSKVYYPELDETRYKKHEKYIVLPNINFKEAYKLVMQACED